MFNVFTGSSRLDATGISVTEEDKRHLGATIGTQAFVESYIERKVSEWVNAVERLSSIAHTQPHAAYAAFTHGLMSKWTYLTRAIPNIGDLLSPLEDVIRRKFLTSLTGQNTFNDVTRKLMTLPVLRLGALGITNPSADTPSHHDASMKITAPLIALIMDQSHQYPILIPQRLNKSG